jgi:hypothetical protein
MPRFKTTINAIALAFVLTIPKIAHSETFIPDTGADLHRYCSAPADSELMKVCVSFLTTLWNTAGLISGTTALVSKPFFCPGPKPAFVANKIVATFEAAVRVNPDLSTAPAENAALVAFIAAYPCK